MSPLTFFNVFRTQYCHLWWRTLDRGHLLLLWWFPTKSNFLNLKFSVRHLYTSKSAVSHIRSTELCFPKHFMYFYIGSSLKATFYLVAVVDFKRGCFCRKVFFLFFFFNQTRSDFNKLFSQLSSQCWRFMVCFICSYFAFHFWLVYFSWHIWMPSCKQDPLLEIQLWGY